MQKFEEMAQEGLIGAIYTQNGWFVKIKPATTIYKVLFSFVKKGSSGKESFDIYMPVQKFQLLCEDIKSYRFYNLCKLDKQKQETSGKYFPGAFQFVTGENGQKLIKMGASKNGGIVIQGTIDMKSWASVPTDYETLREVAFWWDCYSSASNWMLNAGSQILSGTRRADSYHSNNQPQSEETTTATNNSKSQDKIYNVALKTTGEISRKGEDTLVPVTDGKRNYSLLIYKKDESKWGNNWSTLAQYSSKGIDIRLKVLVKENDLVFVDVA